MFKTTTEAMTVIAGYEANGLSHACNFNSLKFAEVHPDIAQHFPRTGKLDVMDIGAGSGRDAEGLAKMGHHVKAIEPSEFFFTVGERRTRGEDVWWKQDALPYLEMVLKLRWKADFILCNAVLMHMPPAQQELAIANMAACLKPGGRLLVKGYDGAAKPQRHDRPTWPMPLASFNPIAKKLGLTVGYTHEGPDKRPGKDTTWITVRLDSPQAA